MSPELLAPAAWITSSREAATQARTLLRETHSLIALNRRLLNPWWGISGSSDHDGEGVLLDGEGVLLRSLLDRLRRGVLVPVPARVWAGMGTGQTCAICTQVIHADEIENEIDIKGGGVTVKLWAHVGCLAIWRHATDVYANQHTLSTDGHPA